jgi:TM2 domain-containing membrane protein YozV
MEEITHEAIPHLIKKYPLIAAAASLFSSGVGQVLCGRVTRGIVLSVSSLLITYTYSFVQVILSLFNVSTTIPLYVIQPASLLLSVLIRVWAVYDAYDLACNLKTGEDRAPPHTREDPLADENP